MTLERLCTQLQDRAPGVWELYRKTAESRERVCRAGSTSVFSRREEGWAARWWESGSLRFASASTPLLLEGAMTEAASLPLATSRTPPPEWPTATHQATEAGEPVEAPPELFETLGRQLSAESRERRI